MTKSEQTNLENGYQIIWEELKAYLKRCIDEYASHKTKSYTKLQVLLIEDESILLQMEKLEKQRRKNGKKWINKINKLWPTRDN